MRLAIIAWVAIGTRASAQDSTSAPRRSPRRISSALVQVAYGTGFHDNGFGFATQRGMMSTLALTAGTHWGRHDGSLFAAMLGGRFVDAAGAETGERTHMLVEWTSEVRMSTLRTASLRSDFFLAGMVTRDGAGFEANQIGAGSRVAHGGSALGLTVFYRRILGTHADTKSRFDWFVPLQVGGMRAHFLGYEDVSIGRSESPSLSGVPTLVVLAGGVIGLEPADLQIGVKYFNHRSASIRTSAPQLVVRIPLG